MGTVIMMADHRPKQPTPEQITRRLYDGIERTPELALILALYDQLPRKRRGTALAKVMMMAERSPDCEASKKAGQIAILLVLQQEGR